MEEELGFYNSTEFPEELSEAGNGNSVDVLIYNTKTGERSVGWFNFNQFKWYFLMNENIKKFKWRYFIDKYDTPKKETNAKSRKKRD